MKKTRDTLPPPGGRRAKPNDKEADVKKCTIKRSEIDFALWQKIEPRCRGIRVNGRKVASEYLA